MRQAARHRRGTVKGPKNKNTRNRIAPIPRSIPISFIDIPTLFTHQAQHSPSTKPTAAAKSGLLILSPSCHKIHILFKQGIQRQHVPEHHRRRTVDRELYPVHRGQLGQGIDDRIDRQLLPAP